MALVSGAGSQLYVAEVDAGINREIDLNNYHKWIYQINSSNFVIEAPTLQSNQITSQADRGKGAKGAISSSGDVVMNVPLYDWSFWLRHVLGEKMPKIQIGPVTEELTYAVSTTYDGDDIKSQLYEQTGIKIYSEGVTTGGVLSVIGTLAGADHTVDATISTGDSYGVIGVFDTVTSAVTDAALDGGTFRIVATESGQTLLGTTLVSALPATFIQPRDGQPVELDIVIAGSGTVEGTITLTGSDINGDRLIRDYEVDASGTVTNPSLPSFYAQLTALETDLEDTRSINISNRIDDQRVRMVMEAGNNPVPGFNLYQVVGGDPDAPSADDEAKIKTTVNTYVNTININIADDALTTATVGLLGLDPYPNEAPDRTANVQRGDATFDVIPSDSFANWNAGLFRSRNSVEEQLEGISVNITINNNYEIRRVLNQTRKGVSVRRAAPGFREITVDIQKSADSDDNQTLEDFLDNILVEGLAAKLFNADRGGYPYRFEIISGAGQLRNAPEGPVESSGEISDPINTTLVPVTGMPTIMFAVEMQINDIKFLKNYS